ncbi:hypothetical protein ABIF33_004520 [Bradyrhizobium elkanii]
MTDLDTPRSGGLGLAESGSRLQHQAADPAGGTMKSIAHAAPAVDIQAAPKLHKRNVALDRARTFLTLVVLLHHAVIPYTYFGHTDPTSWIGFDCVVLATDSFFMAMFFFLSGLFVWPGLGNKPWLIFLRDRLLRLGLPFVICAVSVIPLAYYAIALRQTPGLTFSEFWWKTMTVGPWPSGPIWFVYVLMAFDLTASLLYRVSPRLLDPINRLSIKGFQRPSKFWLFLVIVSAAAYLPMLIHYGQNYWFEFGPFFGAGEPRAAVCVLFLHRRGNRGGEPRGRPAQRAWTADRKALVLDRHHADPLLFDVGDDLHQAHDHR